MIADASLRPEQNALPSSANVAGDVLLLRTLALKNATCRSDDDTNHSDRPKYRVRDEASKI